MGALALAALAQVFPGRARAAPPTVIPDGDTSGLLEAIENPSSGGTITLAKNGTYVVPGSPIQIEKQITIRGRCATIDGDGLSRIFNVSVNGNLTIDDLTVTGGMVSSGSGGAIFNFNGTVTLLRSSLSNNEIALGNGGGIFNSGGTVAMSQSSISGNSTSSAGGGICNDGSGTVIMDTNSVITENTAASRGSGILNNNGQIEGAEAGVNVYNNTPNDIGPPCS